VKIAGDLPRIILTEHFDLEQRPLVINQIDEEKGGRVSILHLGSGEVTMREGARCESKIIGQTVKGAFREVVALNAKG
jgi:hypothetical protein